MYSTLIAIFIGGGLGSLARFGISKIVTSNFQHINPLSTFISNLISTIILGLIIYLASQKISISPSIKLMIVTGFCGGFSTFSTFSYETVELLRLGNFTLALVNIFINILLVIGAIFILAKSL